ncbi:MAG: hypothetical protein HKL99_14465 [Burkholderiales bacterium]|jgi:hypothetical protein|nr:hypothetical protein [Burkholderiales bacterium]
MDRPAQAQRDELVRNALARDDRLVRHLADWIGRDLSGYDRQNGLPWRIESEIALMLNGINELLEKTMNAATPVEILKRDAQLLGAVVDHDLAPVPADAVDASAHERDLLDALELGVEPVGLGV